MKILKFLIGVVGSVFFLGILVGIGWFLVTGVFDFLSELDKIILAALIAVGGVVITAITAIFVKKVEKKHEVEAQFREEKVALFNSLLQEFDKLSSKDKKGTEELVPYLKDFQRKLIFWGGSKVLKSYLTLRGRVRSAKTIGELGEQLQTLGSLILAMRKDLGLSNRGIDEKTFAAHLILRHADVFLKHLKTNPKMTNDEYTKVERELDRQLGIS